MLCALSKTPSALCIAAVLAFAVPQIAAINVPLTSNLALRGGAFTRKTFDLGSALQDHLQVMKSIPKIFDSYAGPNKLDAQVSESVMLAVNSVNACPYCTSLHGELGRMAGLEDKVDQINTAKDGSALKKVAKDPEVAYARKFGECNGRGAALEDQYSALVKAVGPGKAAAVNAQCWFLHWGSTCGNTLLSFWKGRLLGNSKCGSSLLFEVAFALYYTPCYLAIDLTSRLLKLFPAKVCARACICRA